jgi:hypothetical protein
VSALDALLMVLNALLTVLNALLTVLRRSVPSRARSVRYTFASITCSNPPSTRLTRSLEVPSPLDFGRRSLCERKSPTVGFPFPGDRAFGAQSEPQ